MSKTTTGSSPAGATKHTFLASKPESSGQERAFSATGVRPTAFVRRGKRVKRSTTIVYLGLRLDEARCIEAVWRVAEVQALPRQRRYGRSVGLEGGSASLFTSPYLPPAMVARAQGLALGPAARLPARQLPHRDAHPPGLSSSPLLVLSARRFRRQQRSSREVVLKAQPIASGDVPPAADSVSEEVLDSILAWQFLVAWAGEGRSEPRRFGWWDTALVDEYGGGDVLARLAPRTHAWAALEAVREVARRIDAKARSKHGRPDAMRTIFFLGFELDERLADRLSALKRSLRPPDEALRLPLALSGKFNRGEVTAALSGGKVPSFEAVPPTGRRLPGPIPSPPRQSRPYPNRGPGSTRGRIPPPFLSAGGLIPTCIPAKRQPSRHPYAP